MGMNYLYMRLVGIKKKTTLKGEVLKQNATVPPIIHLERDARVILHL